MNQSGNNNQRILGIIGIFVAIGFSGVIFQNCGPGVKTIDVDQMQMGLGPTPVMPNPTATPQGGGVGVFSPMSGMGAPAARCQHVGTPVGTQYFVWGGVTPGVNMPQDGGVYNPANNTWAAVTATGAPGPRNFGNAVYTGTSVIVWGGSYTSNLNTGGIFNLTSGAWTTVGTVGAPAGRYNHAAVWTGNRMIVYGGMTTNGTLETYLNTGGIYDPATNTWAAMASGPTTAGISSGTWTGTHLVVFGGGRGNQGGIYNPTTDTWAPLPATGIPGARDAHIVHASGGKVVVWGGYRFMNGQNFYDNSGGILDLTTNVWTSTSSVGVPSGGIDRSIGLSSTKIMSYEPQLTAGGVLDIATNTWAPMNVNNGLSSRFHHASGAVGNVLVTWGGCVQNNGVSSGFNTGTVYQ